MAWTLFLDDERTPHWFLSHNGEDVLVARSSDEARQLIADFGLPERISFDHDLGGADTGMVFLWWLIDEDMEGHFDLKTITHVYVHSLNPIGTKNIQELWDGYARDIGSEVRAKRDYAPLK
jgi:hypothetical protein